jgi:hypothetical protein
MGGRSDVRAMPGFDGWRVELLRGGVNYIMPTEEAEAVGYALIAAAATAKMRAAEERALPLVESVRLFLARLCYMTPTRIAKDLSANETDVRAALDELVTAGRVRSKAPEWPDLYEAVDRSGAWPEE